MQQTYCFVHIDEHLHAVLNYEQQHAGSDAFVLYPIVGGRLEIYKKLKSKAWTDQAIHERLFPRSHLYGRWTPFCNDLGKQPQSIESLMTWSKAELANAVRDMLDACLPTLQHMGKRDIAVLYQRLHQERPACRRGA